MLDGIIAIITLIIIVQTISFALLMVNPSARKIKFIWKFGITVLVYLVPIVNWIIKVLGVEKHREHLNKFHYKLKDEIHLTNEKETMTDYVNLVNILSKDLKLSKKDVRAFLLLDIIYKKKLKGPIKLKTFSHIFGETGVRLFDLQESKTDYGSYAMLVYKTRGLKFVRSEEGQRLISEAQRVNGTIYPESPKLIAFYTDMQKLYPSLVKVN